MEIPALHIDDQERADQWAGWSYYRRYYVHDSVEEYAACDLLLAGLAEPDREGELRAEVDRGNLCAFVRLIGILVDDHRLDDLRELARDGDGRAFVTLMQLLVRREAEAQLRQESVEFPWATSWLAALLVRQGRVDAALEVLDSLRQHPDYEHGAHSRILSVLREADRVDELRRLADSGDRGAGKQLNWWLFDHHDVNGLRRRAADGDDLALRCLARLLGEPGDSVAAASALQELADCGHPRARKLLERFRSDAPG
ncbi:hypothetical protein KUA19_36090 [Catellatospora sp. NEAU-YM18]|nr:hypothetical protein [Catellatospora tritici]